MKGLIRKISVGTDYPNNVIHYVIGQKYIINKEVFIIKSIIWDKELVQLTGDNTYHILVETPKGDVIVWNTISKMPVKIEYDLTFE